MQVLFQCILLHVHVILCLPHEVEIDAHCTQYGYTSCHFFTALCLCVCVYLLCLCYILVAPVSKDELM